MSHLDKIKAKIKASEGLRLTPYRDTRRVLTIGYGHKITPSDGLYALDEITQQKAEDLFEHDFYWIMSGVRQLVPYFDLKPEGVQTALVDMAYNNGVEGLSRFKKFLYFVNTGNYYKAADEIVDSANYRSDDLHGRYVELEKMVRDSHDTEGEAV